MRRSILPLALVAFALAACRDGSGPDSPIALPLSLRVVPARTSVVSGDTVTVRLTARNPGTRPVTLDSEFGCLLGVRLENPAGGAEQASLFRPAGSCPAPRIGVSIAPGDSLVEEWTWEAGIIVGGDVFSPAQPGRWVLHPVVNTGSGQLAGTLDVPATVTVVSR